MILRAEIHKPSRLRTIPRKDIIERIRENYKKKLQVYLGKSGKT